MIGRVKLKNKEEDYEGRMLNMRCTAEIFRAGRFVSIVTGSTPLANEAWGLSNKMTSSALGAIGEVGGPRCCKRDSYLAIARAVEFVKEHLGVTMENGKIECTHSAQNNQCIGKRCPFFKK